MKVYASAEMTLTDTNDGISVTGIDRYYMASSSSSGITVDSKGWMPDPQETNLISRYHWSYEVVNYSDGEAIPSKPAVIGVYGDSAKMLYLSATAESMTFDADGAPNPSSQEITLTANLQNVSGNASFVATAYNGSTVVSDVVLSGVGNTRTFNQAQFPASANRVHVRATLGNLVDTVTIVKLSNGSKGQNAVVGLLTNESITLPANKDGLVSNFTGATGIFDVYDGITKKTGSGVTYSLVSQSNITVAINATTGVYSVTAMPTGTTILNGFATLRAIYNGVTIEKQLNVSKSVTGATGAQGASATSYWITASNNIIAKSQTGVINPTTITFTGYSKTGTANSALYAGRFIIQTSTNGTSYTTRYTSSANQNAYTYTIPVDTKFIKALLYQAGGTSILLDEQTVPVVESAEGIQVGGRNYLKNAQRIQLNDSDRPDTRNHEFSDGVCKITVLRTDLSNYGWLQGFLTDKSLGDLKGGSITVSLDVRTKSNGFRFRIDARDGSHQYLVGSPYTSIPDTKDEWLRVHATLNFPDDNNTRGWILASFSNSGSLKIGDILEYKDFKLEKGNKATDWTPAPEDIQAELDDKASNEHVNIIKGDLEKLIGTTEEGIETRVSQKYVETNTFNAVSEKVTKMSQSIDGFDFTFDSKSLIDNLNEATGEAEKELQTIRKYIQFTSNGSIILGASDSPSKVEITRDKISFRQNDKEVAWFSNQSFNIESGTILTDLQVGDHKFEKSGTGRTRISYAKKNN